MVGLADLPLTYALDALCRRWSARGRVSRQPAGTAGEQRLPVAGMSAARALEELVRDVAPPRSLTRGLGVDALVVEDLAKTYPDGTHAVLGVSLRVASGDSYGILGPNGAGNPHLWGCSPR